MVEYIIGADDLSGPFAPEIPDNLQDMAALKRLAYRDPAGDAGGTLPRGREPAA